MILSIEEDRQKAHHTLFSKREEKKKLLFT